MRVLGITASATIQSGPSFLLYGTSNTGAFVSADAISWNHYNTQYLWSTTGSTIDQFVTIGSSLYAVDNFLYVTTDGTTWNAPDKWPFIGGGLRIDYKIGYLDNKYISQNGTLGLVSSTDTVTWTPSNIAILMSVPSYSGSTYVSATNDCTVHTSTDLVTWTTRTLPFGGGASDEPVATVYGNGRFAYLGDISGGVGPKIASSTDGITWTDTTPAGVSTGTGVKSNRLAYGNALFLLVPGGITDKYIFTSTDSVTWTSRNITTTTDYVSGCGVANNLYFSFDRNETAQGTAFHSSTNGTTWTKRTIFAAGSGRDNNLSSIEYYSGKYYLGLRTSDTTDNTNIYSTTNLTSFTAVNKGGVSIDIENVNSATYANNKYTFVGAAGYMVEANSTLTTWTTRTSSFGTTAINGIIFGNATYVAVGAAGQLRSSTDGITWTSRTSTFGTTAINSVGFGTAVYVAVGNAAQLRSSTDGTTWTTRTSQFGSSGINSVRFLNNNFVASGAGGRLSYSTDGITWTGVSVGTLPKYDIAFGAGVYISVGADNSFHTSTNLATWTTRTGPLAATDDAAAVMFKNNIFVTVSNAPGSGQFYQYYTSTDAITWTSRSLPGGAAVNGLSFTVPLYKGIVL